MKIFGIGLSKTGTTTLEKCFNILGYKTKGYPYWMIEEKQGKITLNMDEIAKYEVLIENPIFGFYQELDKTFPDSKFILTTRDLDSWLKSTQKHFSQTRALARGTIKGKSQKKFIQEFYGSEIYNEKKFKEAYQRHHKNVRDYFSGRNNLLIYNICNGEDWAQLCKFLEEQIPNVPFPVENKSTNLKNILLSDTMWEPIYNLKNKVKRPIGQQFSPV
jgi:hypothetical protein